MKAHFHLFEHYNFFDFLQCLDFSLFHSNFLLYVASSHTHTISLSLHNIFFLLSLLYCVRVSVFVRVRERDTQTHTEREREREIEKERTPHSSTFSNDCCKKHTPRIKERKKRESWYAYYRKLSLELAHTKLSLMWPLASSTVQNTSLWTSQLQQLTTSHLTNTACSISLGEM